MNRHPATVTDEIAALTAELPPQYEVLSKVSEGGMGAIYKARNRYTKRFCAVKIMRPDAATDKGKILRFVQEAKAASLLDHRNICRFFDFGMTKNDFPYLVMDWIEGTSLSAKVEQDGPLNAQQTEIILQQVADALAHAHSYNVIHRDLKPDNIMLSGDLARRPNVHLVDFGIAKLLSDNQDVMQPEALTRTGMVVGTPMYMSPEQARGKDVDGRSDIYSLGCVLHFMLSGKPPFVGETFVETLYKHIHAETPEFDARSKVPAILQNVFTRCMEKEPERRFQSMGEINDSLQKAQFGVAVAPPAPRITKRQSRRIVTVLFFVVGFAVAYFASTMLQGLLDTVAPEKKASASPPVVKHAAVKKHSR